MNSSFVTYSKGFGASSWTFPLYSGDIKKFILASKFSVDGSPRKSIKPCLFINKTNGIPIYYKDYIIGLLLSQPFKNRKCYIDFHYIYFTLYVTASVSSSTEIPTIFTLPSHSAFVSNIF